MDEGQHDAGGHLLVAHVLHQVGAHPPVLLGRLHDLVVHPAAVGRLQERVVQEEEEAAAGLEHAGHLTDRRLGVQQVLEDQAGDDSVEGVVGERELLGAGPGVHRSSPALGGGPDL